MPELRVAVVGGGILGAAVARRVLAIEPDAVVTILEKEGGPARHQSGRNSGVVHAGIPYPPGSLKATLCRRGMELLREYCAERNVPYLECGKLIVARDVRELSRLDALATRARANGVPGLRQLGPPASRKSSRMCAASPRSTRRTPRSPTSRG